MRDKKAVKAGRPAFFSDPEIDRLLAITVRLMTEHSVLTSASRRWRAYSLSPAPSHETDWRPSSPLPTKMLSGPRNASD